MPLKAFLVEDNPAIREGLREALGEMAGIETMGFAASEKAAVAWLSDPAHEWDVVVIDLVLEPGGSGFGVLRAVQSRGPGRKAVVLTGSANPEVRRQCEALGGDGVFDKAIETEALLDYCAGLSRQNANR